MRLPPRPPLLAGREDLLAALDARLLADDGPARRTISLCGLGGAGKTSVAVEYAYRHLEQVGLAWQFAAEDAAVLAAGFGELAAQLGARDLGDTRDPVVSVHAVLARFPAPWLLIFDNAADRASVAEFLPPTGPGRVLITSQNPNWPPGHALRVPVLDTEVAAGFLINRTADANPQAADAAGELAVELGGLPLALEQAGAYIQATGGSIAGYLAFFRQRRADMLGRGKPTGHSETVAATWALAFGRLEQSAPGAVGLLRLLAYCAPEAVPLRLLLQSRPGLAEQLAGAVAPALVPLLEDELAANDAIEALRQYSLITLAADGLVSVHRLVQAVTRHRLGEQERHAWAQRAVELLRRAFPADPDEPTAWPRCSQLLAHVLAATENARVEGVVASETSASLLTDTGAYLRARAQLDLAQTVLERAAEIREAALGKDHPDVAVTLTYLGTVLRRRGKPVRAQQVLERALEIREGALGRDHPDVAMTLTHLGTALRDAGDLSGGQAVLERALAIREAALGKDHPDVAVTLTYLGTVLRRRSEPARAQQVLERALEINKTAYGLQDPRLAVTLAHLGHALRELDDLTQARAAHESALAIRQSVYHRQHPEVAFAFRDLGRTLRDAGDLTGARSHIERALGIFEAAYGPMHPETATSLYHLAIVLRDQGDLDDARSLHERALTIREASLGPNHPDTAQSRKRLAAVVRELANRE